MKIFRKLLILYSLCLFCGSTQAALNADTVWEVRTTGAQTNGGGFRWLSVRSATYKWTASGSGTNEYYCELAAGGNPSLTEAKCCTTDATFNLDTNGTLGSLNAGEWDWGNNDSLGYSTVYIRLDDGADPDSKAVGFVEIGNGGGYDYTQQSAAQLTLTDCNHPAGSSTLTSATGGFTALMVGNIIYIASGTNFTAGWYEITVYTNTNTVTVDRSLGASAGSANGAGKVGGAWFIGGALDDEFTEALVAGNTVHVKTGTYTATVPISQAVDGTALLPITWIGYTTTRNDATVGTNRPLFDFTGINCTFGDYTVGKNIRFTPTNPNGILGGFYSTFYNCKFTNSSATAGRYALYSTTCKVVSCEASSTNGIAVYCEGPDTVVNCYIHDSATGIQSASSSAKFIGNIIDTCVTGISYTAAAPINHVALQNTIYNCTTGISGGVCSASTFVNNVITACTTGASWTTNQKINFWDYNCWNNTTDVSNVTKGPHDITANPLLTDPANGDFTLQTGSPCLDAGLQIGANEGVTGDYKQNIGVDQDDNAAAPAGGGATVYMTNF